jgi:DNA-binding transcriptional ArsR family regulator
LTGPGTRPDDAGSPGEQPKGEASAPHLLECMRALSNPLRLQLLQWLREPERYFILDGAIADPVKIGVCVSHIQAKVGLAQSTVSAYMAELQRVGLVRATRVGKWTHYKRDEERISEFVALLGEALRGSGQLAAGRHDLGL